MIKKTCTSVGMAVIALHIAACSGGNGDERGAADQVKKQANLSQDPGLSHYYEDSFLLGTALNRAQIYAPAADDVLTEKVRGEKRGYYYQRKLLTDPRGLEIAQRDFNALTPENAMKWEEIHPQLGVYDFDAADRFLEIAEATGMHITAHTLVWHNQTPDWVFEDEEGQPLSREALLERMREHIHTVVGRYKGRIHAWDVVNEAVNEDGSLRQSKWLQIIGEDYLAKAFEYAHEADPQAQLNYNDYSLENPDKRAGVVRLVKSLQERGAPISAVGNQSHYGLSNFPELSEVEQVIEDLAALDLKVMITELDINTLPSARGEEGEIIEGTDIYTRGLPEEKQLELAERYRQLFEIYREHSEQISRVTLWGFADGDSWLNYLPTERVNHPLLFDRQLRPKAAYSALIEAAK